MVYDLEGKPVTRFHLENAWPSRVEISGLKAEGGGQVLLESVTFVSDLLERVSP